MALKIIITDPDKDDRDDGKIKLRKDFEDREYVKLEAIVIATDDAGNRVPAMPPGTFDFTVHADHSTEGHLTSDPTGPPTPQ